MRKRKMQKLYQNYDWYKENRKREISENLCNFNAKCSMTCNKHIYILIKRKQILKENIN